MSFIELEVDGELKKVEVRQLTKSQASSLKSIIGEVYKTKFSPFSKFTNLLSAIPISPALHTAITRIFVRVLSETVNLDSIRQDLMEQTTYDLNVVKKVCILVTGQDLVTEKNKLDAMKALMPFLKPEEGIEMTMEEANAFRAKLGKPPIGVKEKKNG